MLEDKSKIELNRLILQLMDGCINDDQLTELDECLRQSSEAKAYYCEFMRTQACMRNVICSIASNDVLAIAEDSNVSLKGIDVTNDVLSDKKEAAVSGQEVAMDNNVMQALQELAEFVKTAPEVIVEKPIEELEKPAGPPIIKPARPERKMSKFSVFTLIFSAAAMIFLALFIKFVPEPLPGVEVATLTDQMNVQWGDSGSNYENGERLLTNDFPFDLKKGFVSIEYDEGVEVVVEGPALFEIQRSGVYLEYGRLYSKVTDAGLGFTVRTPTSQFVDQGTEFGVKADIDGSSELHVIKGKVQLFAGSNKDTKFSQMVTTGTAVVYNANTHQIKSTSVAKHRFVSKIDSKTKSILRGYANRYEQAIAETKPVAYYRFEKGQDALGYDEMSGSVTPCDYSEAVTFAPGPAINSVYENQSLYLSGDADSGIFLSDKTAIQSGGRALSISLWIQPGPAMDGQQSIIYFTDHEKRTDHVMTNQLYLTPDNRVGFYVYNIFNTQIPIPFTDWDGLSRENTVKFELKTLEPLPDNEWSHVVGCFSDQKIELYVNGQLCETKPIPIRTECYQGGYWGIGCLTNARNLTLKTKKLSYKGFIDEVGFYDRKLSAQEVRLLYDAAKPLR